MKKNNLIFFAFSVLTILSCKKEKNLESKITMIKQENSQLPQTEIAKTKDSLDIIFIGKTTMDLEQYNLHECFGSLIEKSENEKYAVSQYALNIDNCRNGKSKMFLQKLLNYYDGGKANFEIKDELAIISDCPKKCYSTTVLNLDKNQPEKQYLIEYEDNSKEILTKVFKCWEINLDTQKFVEIELPKNFKCNNPQYADGI